MSQLTNYSDYYYCILDFPALTVTTGLTPAPGVGSNPQVRQLEQGTLTEREGWLSTDGLLVLTSLTQFIFILKILFTFVAKQANLMRRSAVLWLEDQLLCPSQLTCRNIFFEMYFSTFQCPHPFSHLC